MLNRVRILAIFAIVAIIGLGFTACNDDGNGGNDGGDGSPGCDASCLAIGAAGPGGGKIIYHNHAGFSVEGIGICHYLEAAPTNQATSITWCSCTYNYESTDYGYCDVTTGTEIGTGKANTAAIITAHSGDTADNNAAKVASMTIGGKSDWFLPSEDELIEMYKARTHLGIESGWFWSSSQFDWYNDYYKYAWGKDFASVNTSASYKDNYSDLFVVRAVRAF